MIAKLSCPNENCRNIILRKGGDGMWRFSIKSMVTSGDGEQLIAICKSCKSEVPTPFSLHSFQNPMIAEDLQKSEVPKRTSYDVNYNSGFAVVSRDDVENSS